MEIRRSSKKEMQRTCDALMVDLVNACNKAMEKLPGQVVKSALDRVAKSLSGFGPNEGGSITMISGDSGCIAGPGLNELPAESSIHPGLANPKDSIQELLKLLEEATTPEYTPMLEREEVDFDNPQLPERALRKLKEMERNPSMLLHQRALTDLELSLSEVTLTALSKEIPERAVSHILETVATCVRKDGDKGLKYVRKLSQMTLEHLPQVFTH
jgi:hypothetical protein